jgi:hypothetical protein
MRGRTVIVIDLLGFSLVGAPKTTVSSGKSVRSQRGARRDVYVNIVIISDRDGVVKRVLRVRECH